MKTLLLAISITLLLTSQDGIAKFAPDTTGPSFALRANDGNRAGPIAWDSNSIPAALGCDGSYGEYGWNPGWDDTYTQTDFYDPVTQSLSYFFTRDHGEINGVPFEEPVTFTLRASDMSGIKRMEIQIDERNAIWYGDATDGPTTFSNYPQNAIAFLEAVYVVLNGYGVTFNHWQKVLRLDLPNNSPTQFSSMLRFSVNTFGNDGMITVEVEDKAGNVSTDTVYLADDRLCH